MSKFECKFCHSLFPKSNAEAITAYKRNQQNELSVFVTANGILKVYSNSINIIKKIHYCPMCGRKFR
jgi:hypothetical protein